MDICYHISPVFKSKYYEFLVIHFSNGQVFIAPVLKSTFRIDIFLNTMEFKSLYLSHFFDIPPSEV